MELQDSSISPYTDRTFQTVLFAAKREAAHIRGQDAAIVTQPCDKTLRKYRRILQSSVVTQSGQPRAALMSIAKVKKAQKKGIHDAAVPADVRAVGIPVAAAALAGPPKTPPKRRKGKHAAKDGSTL